MSKSKDIFKALIQEDVLTAKKLINEALLEKLGSSLEQKLVNFAPSVFSEGNQQNTQESTDYDEDLEEISEYFESELNSLIEEIEMETGTKLTEDEIKDTADNFFELFIKEQE
jgi:hypothetical protein